MKLTSNEIPCTLDIFQQVNADPLGFFQNDYVWGDSYDWIPPASIAGKSCLLEVKTLYLKATKTTTSDPGYLALGLEGIGQVNTYACCNIMRTSPDQPPSQAFQIAENKRTDIIGIQTTAQSMSQFPQIVVQVPQGATQLKVRVYRPQEWIPEIENKIDLAAMITLTPINS